MSNRMEIIEQFADAQEWTVSKLQSQRWRSHGATVENTNRLSDEELLEKAWADLPGSALWSAVRGYEGDFKHNGPVSSVCEATVKRLAAGGATQNEIADEIGVALKTVRNFMSRRKIRIERRKGVPLNTLAPSRLKPLRLNESEATAQYLAGWSLNQVALEHGCSSGTIRTMLRRRGVKCRSLKEALRGSGVFGRSRVHLDDAKVTELRILALVHGETWEAVGMRYGLSWSAARAAGLGLTWSHVPMPQVVVEALSAPRRRGPKGKHDAAKAVELYLSGKSLREVGRVLGCNNMTVSRMLKQQGVAARPGRVDAVSNRDEMIVSCRLAGMSLRQIEKAVGASFRTVQKVLRRADAVCSNEATKVA